MIGKINYGTGGLSCVEDEAHLPVEGSKSTLYYIEETNTFVVWDSENYGWIRLRTRQNIYLLNDSNLNDKSQEITQVSSSKLTPASPDIIESPEIGDIVFDSLGACGNIISKGEADIVNVKTQQANLTKKVEYSDQSWDMWTSDELNGGHYSWDSSTGILRYEGFNRDRTSPIIYETYSVNGGGNNFNTSGGTLIGTRMILAWDGGSPGNGTIRYYYTKGKNNDEFNSNEELVTVGDVYSILQAETGIYVGIAETEYELNRGNIVGTPTGHTIHENDWAYVMHYAPNVKQYDENTSFSVGDIIEYNSALYEAEKEFIKTNWTKDQENCFEYVGTRCSFIYSDGNWILGMEIEQDIPFPDDLRLTLDSHNKMTIKAGGVDTISIKDLNVTNPKLSDGAVTNNKIADSTIAKEKLDSSLQDTITKAETCWYSENFIVSPTQPAVPKSGYIIWIDSSTSTL